MAILIYKRLSEEEMKELIDETAPQIEEWFKNNPRRRVCRTELWYGRQYTFKRKNVKEQLTKFAEEWNK